MQLNKATEKVGVTTMQTSSQEKPTHEQTKWAVLYPDYKTYEMYENIISHCI